MCRPRIGGWHAPVAPSGPPASSERRLGAAERLVTEVVPRWCAARPTRLGPGFWPAGDGSEVLFGFNHFGWTCFLLLVPPTPQFLLPILDPLALQNKLFMPTQFLALGTVFLLGEW